MDHNAPAAEGGVQQGLGPSQVGNGESVKGLCMNAAEGGVQLCNSAKWSSGLIALQLKAV